MSFHSELVGVYHDSNLVHLLVGAVDFTVDQPFLYLESFEVEGISVYPAEWFSHVVITVLVVPVVLGDHVRGDNHAHMIHVWNIRQLQLCREMDCLSYKDRSRNCAPEPVPVSGCFRRY